MSGDISLSYQHTVNVSVHQEESFAMRLTDWSRLRTRVQRLRKQRREFSAAAWTFVGIAISAVFAGLSWAPAYRVLGESERGEFAWIWPALICMGVLGVLMSAGMFWAAHVTKQSAAETIDSLAEDMDAIRDVRELIS